MFAAATARQRISPWYLETASPGTCHLACADGGIATRNTVTSTRRAPTWARVFRQTPTETHPLDHENRPVGRAGYRRFPTFLGGSVGGNGPDLDLWNGNR